MFSRLIVIALSGSLIAAHSVSALAQSNTQQEDPAVREIREKVTEIDRGKKTRVEVILQDKSKVKGYVSVVTTDGFTLSDKNQTRTIAYRDVQKIRKAGKNKLVAWIAVGAIGFVITGLVVTDAQR